jgi:hypothetical protein
MDHHYRRWQKLDSFNEFGKGIVSQGKYEIGKSKGHSQNQQDLQCTEDTVQQSCDNVDCAPTPTDKKILVRQDTQIQQDTGGNVNSIELRRGKFECGSEEFSPGTISHLQDIVQVDKAQGLPDRPRTHGLPNFIALITGGSDGSISDFSHAVNQGEDGKGQETQEHNDVVRAQVTVECRREGCSNH